MSFCKNCGSELNGKRFCTVCGTENTQDFDSKTSTPKNNVKNDSDISMIFSYIGVGLFFIPSILLFYAYMKEADNIVAYGLFYQGSYLFSSSFFILAMWGMISSILLLFTIKKNHGKTLIKLAIIMLLFMLAIWLCNDKFQNSKDFMQYFLRVYEVIQDKIVAINILSVLVIVVGFLSAYFDFDKNQNNQEKINIFGCSNKNFKRIFRLFFILIIGIFILIALFPILKVKKTITNIISVDENEEAGYIYGQIQETGKYYYVDANYMLYKVDKSTGSILAKDPNVLNYGYPGFASKDALYYAGAKGEFFEMKDGDFNTTTEQIKKVLDIRFSTYGWIGVSTSGKCTYLVTSDGYMEKFLNSIEYRYSQVIDDRSDKPPLEGEWGDIYKDKFYVITRETVMDDYILSRISLEDGSVEETIDLPVRYVCRYEDGLIGINNDGKFFRMDLNGENYQEYSAAVDVSKSNWDASFFGWNDRIYYREFGVDTWYYFPIKGGEVQKIEGQISQLEPVQGGLASVDDAGITLYDYEGRKQKEIPFKN